MKQLNNIIIETERLYLRKLQLSDMQALRDILQDKEVMYAYEHSFSDEEVVQWYERQQERYVQDSVGLLSVIIKNLEKSGYVTHRADECDKRKCILHITDKGAYLIKQVFPENKEMIINSFNNLSDNEKDELLRLLKKLGK